MMRIRLIALTLLTLGLAAGNAYGATATRTSSFEYDATSGLLTKEVIEPDNSDLCLVTTYTYDPFGNLLTTVAHDASGAKPDITTALTYDLWGRKKTMADPDMGAWSYAYDVLGRMTNRTEADLVGNWRAGFIRIDSMHQRDQGGAKGLYHINAVDCVTRQPCQPRPAHGIALPICAADSR
jgi:YD repeat-containing protein